MLSFLCFYNDDSIIRKRIIKALLVSVRLFCPKIYGHLSDPGERGRGSLYAGALRPGPEPANIKLALKHVP